MPARSVNLAVLISGSGSTLQNLIDQIAARSLNARITSVISSRPDLPGIRRAIDAKLPCTVIDRRSFGDVSSFSANVFETIDKSGADLICLRRLALSAGHPREIRKPDHEHPSRAACPASAAKGCTASACIAR